MLIAPVERLRRFLQVAHQLGGPAKSSPFADHVEFVGKYGRVWATVDLMGRHTSNEIMLAMALDEARLSEEGFRLRRSSLIRLCALADDAATVQLIPAGEEGIGGKVAGFTAGKYAGQLSTPNEDLSVLREDAVVRMTAPGGRSPASIIELNADALRAVVSSCSDNDARPILQSFQVDPKWGLAGTDSYRLRWVPHEYAFVLPEEGPWQAGEPYLLPTELADFTHLDPDAEMLSVWAVGSPDSMPAFVWKGEDILVRVKGTTGLPVGWGSLIPQAAPIRVELEGFELQATLTEMARFVGEFARCRLVPDGDRHLVVQTYAESERVERKLRADLAGPYRDVDPGHIVLNPRFVIDALRTFRFTGNEEARFEWIDGHKPVVVRHSDRVGEGGALLMPISEPA